MDDAEILGAVRDDFERIYLESQHWVKEIRGLESGFPKLVNFFDRVMGFRLRPEIDPECLGHEKEIKEHLESSLHGMNGFLFEGFSHSGEPDLHEFIRSLASFLRDLVWFNHSFNIKWVLMSDDVDDEVWGTVEENEFEDARPQVTLGRDFGVENMDKLHHALDRLIENERQYAKSLVNKV